MTAALRQSLQETSWGFQFRLNTAHTELKAQELNKGRGRLAIGLGMNSKVNTHQQLVTRSTSKQLLSSGARFKADGGNFQLVHI